MAELMFEHVYKLHGLPKSIVSDRDVLFTSIFWRRLHELIGTKLHMSSAYHPESDGGTERANRTVTQMLRQCIGPKQKDWVSKLPAIEFAMNSARSESTGYAPFFLNTGRMPRSLIWDTDKNRDYPGIANFAMQRRLAIMAAHDSMIAARVKQTRNANRKRQEEPFRKDDLVYLSTKNIKFEKGLARKLIPKFIGPYAILRDFGNSSFKVELPANMKQRGVHDVVHASLLRIHVPNDDRRFPGRLESQLGISTDATNEWAVERITGHYGRRSEAIFEVLWKSGDSTWMPYDQASKLVALNEYLETIGISDIKALPYGSGKPPADDPQVFAGSVGLDFGLPQLDKSAHGMGDGYPKSPTLPTAETPLEALVNLLNLFPMVWHGDIIENSKISADYAEWNSAHPFCIRQNRESFVLYTDDPNDCGTAYHACDLQVAILHNRLLHNPDRDINYNPAVYPKLVEHLNHYDAVRWAVYHPVDDCISWPSPITSGELSLPTLQEFMVRDSDVFDADSRRSRAIETSKEKVAIRRAGEFEGKLSPEERAKLAAKLASSRAEYVKRVGKKTATPASPQGEGDSGAGGAGGAAGPSIQMEM
jgi:hypothetical protein